MGSERIQLCNQIPVPELAALFAVVPQCLPGPRPDRQASCLYVSFLRCAPGAAGYVRKDAEPETLLAAVRAVARGKTYIDPSVSSQVLHASAPHDELTPREREVLRRLALGLSNKEIADALCIGEETVKTHVGSVLSKLQVENRAQAIVQALRRGLVTLEEL